MSDAPHERRRRRDAARPHRRDRRRPRDLFFTFNRLALQGFGGVLAVAQRELVERKGWLTRAAVRRDAGAEPGPAGPNVVNLALMFGDRFFGLRGAFAALAGMLLVPLAIVVALTFAYGEFSSFAPVAGALRGMGAVAAGLVIATALKLMAALGSSRLGRPLAGAFAALTFVDHRLAALAADLGDRRPRLARDRDRLSARCDDAARSRRAVPADLLGLFAPLPGAEPARRRRRDHDRARHAPLHRRRAPLDHRRAVQRVGRDRPGRAGTERAVRRRPRLERRRAARRAGDDERHAAAVDRAVAWSRPAGARSGARRAACARSPPA